MIEPKLAHLCVQRADVSRRKEVEQTSSARPNDCRSASVADAGDGASCRITGTPALAVCRRLPSLQTPDDVDGFGLKLS
jgi:hypothetical protein